MYNRSDVNKTTTERNGIKAPKPGTISAKIWKWCDQLNKLKTLPKHKIRARVKEKAYNAGILKSTATTQFQRWKTFNG